jgi:biopolymer transport protein ExbB/TolQ
MKETPAPSSPSLAVSLEKLSSSILDRIKRPLLAICVAGFLLIEWHLLPGEWLFHEGKARQIMLSILTLLGGVMVYVIFDTQKAVEAVSRNIASLRQSFKGTLNLLSSMEDLSRELNSVKPNEKIVMCHLALNLEQSWDYIRRHFLEHKNLKDIEVYLLMLPKDPKELQSASPHPVPEEVERWSKSVEAKVKAIERSLNELKPFLERDRRKLKVLIKHYRMVPMVHGYSASGHLRYYYFSFCRWVRSDEEPKYWTYDWGEDDYHKFIGDPNDLAFGDLAKVFDGQFHFLWATSGDPSVNFYHGREADADHSKIPTYD